jgi:RsiW-degrading membrane proteinase PrsW (M82 family)
MSGLWILALLILISAIPVFAAFLWFRFIRVPFTPAKFILFFLAGAAAFFPALLLQSFFPAAANFPSGPAGRWILFRRIFFRIALTEELSRLMVLSLVFWILGRLERKDAPETRPDYSSVSLASAGGLVAGLGFAVLEGAAYGASNAGLVLLRAFTAAPLHAACGARVGAAAVLFRGRTVQALFRFLAAASIHGIYNFMIVMPGFPAIAAVFVALCALASSAAGIKVKQRD